MSAGLPGLGLGGLFFIFSALLAPFRALWLTLRGRSRPGDWAMVGRQFAQAVVMVAAIDLSLRLAYLAISAAGIGNAPSAVSATVIPLTLIGITSALLLAVLAGAKFADLAVGLRNAALPRVPDVLPRPTPLRALAVSGAVGAAWLALLTAGASEMSPLVNPPGEQPTTDQRAARARSSALTPAPSTGRRLVEASADRPHAADVSQPLAEPGYEQNSSGATPPPTVSIAQGHSPTATPPKVVASPAPAGSGNEPASAANPPRGSGPPSTAGPPEGSSAPEHAGPPENAGPSEHAGTEHSSSSTARVSRGA
ncbi:MAG: hypothetical protein QOI84_1927 [Solirubrobacterales bacterium]|nr:hypothetical protein [Solirubrobacterales bacterium]